MLFEFPPLVYRTCYVVVPFARSFTPNLHYASSYITLVISLNFISSPLSQQTGHCFTAHPLAWHVHSRHTLNDSRLTHQCHIELCWDARDHTSVIARELRTWCRHSGTSPEMLRGIFEEGSGFRAFGEERGTATRLLGEDDTVEELDAGRAWRCCLTFVDEFIEC